MTEIIPFKKPVLQPIQEESVLQIFKENRWQLSITLILFLLVHALFFGDYYYTFDDSYVFHVYARNLARGQGFSFNPGEISHAATPLLTFILASQHFLFQSTALYTAKVVNLFFSLGATLLLLMIAYRLTSSPIIALAAALVWAASPLESILSAGPQDFALFAFLILLSLYFYLFLPKSLWTYFFLSLLILTRYEGALYAGLLFLNHLYMEWQNKEFQWKHVVLRLILIGCLPLIWFSYIGTHSTLIPSSGSAKLSPWILGRIPHTLSGLAIFFFVPLILAALTSAWMQIKERSPRIMFLFIWVSFCLLFYGPFLDNRRYYVHLLPFIGLFSLVYLKSVSERYFSSTKSSQVFFVTILALSFSVYFSTNIYYYDQTRGHNRNNAYSAYKHAGLWLKEHTPEQATIALEEIGVIPYFAERKLVDFSGWLDLRSKPYRGKKLDGINPQMLEYLSRKRPDYLIINTDLVTSPRQELLASDPRLKLIYRTPLLDNQQLLIYSCTW